MVDVSTDQVECQVFSKFSKEETNSQWREEEVTCDVGGSPPYVPEEQLKRLVPVVADGHAKQCLLQVCLR